MTMASSYCILNISVRKKSVVQASTTNANRYSLSNNWPQEDEEGLLFTLLLLALRCKWCGLVKPLLLLLSVNEAARGGGGGGDGEGMVGARNVDGKTPVLLPSTSVATLPVLLPRRAKLLYPGEAAMEYDDDDNEGPGIVLLRLGGSSPGF